MNMGYVYILLTVLLTAYGQLVLKWRINLMGPMPSSISDACLYLLRALRDFYVLSTFAAAFLASLTWMAALTKFELSFAYPFMSLAFLLVLLLSILLLDETMTLSKLVGTALILAGIVLLAR
jgi:uncharacterized membrane protein